MDKICPKYIQVGDRLRRTAATKRPTYSHALVGDTNTVVAAAAGTPTAATQSLNQQQIDKARLDLKVTNEAFITELSNDMKIVITDYTGKMLNLKTEIVAEIHDLKNELGIRRNNLES